MFYVGQEKIKGVVNTRLSWNIIFNSYYEISYEAYLKQIKISIKLGAFCIF